MTVITAYIYGCGHARYRETVRFIEIAARVLKGLLL